MSRPKSICSIDGCDNPVNGRGWCHKHYRAWWIHGDPLWSRSANEERRLWESVDKPDAGCWLVTRGTDSAGYGRFRRRTASRFALEQALGRPLAPGMMALHTCDVPACVRNDDEGWYEVNGVVRPRRGHLWEGTQADNVADREAKGRGAKINGAVLHPERLSRGERRYCAKLTDANVLLMRRLHADGARITDLAARFGVSGTTTWKVVHRKSWKHV